MFQKNNFMGTRPAGGRRLGQETRMSTQMIVVRPGPKTTVPRPNVYADFYQPTLVPRNSTMWPPCKPGTTGCTL